MRRNARWLLRGLMRGFLLLTLKHAGCNVSWQLPPAKPGCNFGVRGHDRALPGATCYARTNQI